MSDAPTPVSGLEDYQVIIRCVRTRGTEQAEALAELDRRRLRLSPEQKIAAGIA